MGAPGGGRAAHIGDYQVFERNRPDCPGRVENRVAGADQERALLVCMTFLDYLLTGWQAARIPASPGKPVVRREQLADLSGDLHPGGDEYDEVVADPLQVGDQVGGEHDADPLRGDNSHKAAEELTPRNRVEARDRLIEYE